MKFTRITAKIHELLWEEKRDKNFIKFSLFGKIPLKTLEKGVAKGKPRRDEKTIVPKSVLRKNLFCDILFKVKGSN